MADDPVWGSQSELTAAIALDDDDVLGRDVSDTTDDATGTVGRMKWRAALGLSGLTPGGRLTLESGVPISTTDQTAKGTIYYTPDQHDFVRLYNGTRPHLYQFTERSLALTVTSGKNYDVFLYDNSGTLTLELSAAWTNDTTRDDALAWQAGVGYVKSGTATRLWLGTIRASASNQTELVFGGANTAARCFIWNAYNRVPVSLAWRDTTDSWTYTTATWRQKRASSNNQASIVAGAAGCFASITSVAISYNDSAVARVHGIGLDSTSARAAGCPSGRPVYTAAGAGSTSTTFNFLCPLGSHYVAEIEYGYAAGTSVWYGDVGESGISQSGAVMRWEY